MTETTRSAQWATESDHEFEKRFMVPGVMLTSKCPHCGQDITKDFSEDYLSFPTAGKNEIGFWHDSDDDINHEWTVSVELIIGIHVLETTHVTES